jgi:hypothetical protein
MDKMDLMAEMHKMGYDDVCDLYHSGSFEYVQISKPGGGYRWMPLEMMDMGFVAVFKGTVKRMQDN